MSNFVPAFKPTGKRRSFRPGSFRPLDRGDGPPSLAALSEQLRSSLMNVGMRVRKSVPEGYKTQDAKKAGFTIYEQTAAAHPELLPPVELGGGNNTDRSNNNHHHHHHYSLPADDENAMLSDEQVAATVDDVLSGLDADLAGFGDGGKLDFGDGGFFGGIASSQESSSSLESRASSVRTGPRRTTKRVHAREDDEDEIDRLWGGVPMERDAPLRQISQPRSRRPQMRRNASSLSNGSAKSGARKKVSFAPDDDFGEADFLMPDQV